MNDKKSLASRIKGFLTCVPYRPSRNTQTTETPLNTRGYSIQEPDTRTLDLCSPFANIEPHPTEHIPYWNKLNHEDTVNNSQRSLVANTLYASRWMRYIYPEIFDATFQNTAKYDNTSTTLESTVTSPYVVR